MIETLKAIPWGLIFKYIAGGAAGYVGVKYIASVKAAPAAEKSSGGGGGMSPMFMSAGGGGFAASPAPLPDLGGDTWGVPESPTGESDEVTIARMQKEIAMAQLAAQQSIAEKGFSNLFPQTSSEGLTGNGNPFALPEMQFQGPIDNGSRTIAGSQSKVGYKEAVDYTKSVLGRGESGLKTLYSQAMLRGYSTSDVASMINTASGKSNTSGNLAEQKAAVNAWIAKNNLATLK